MRLFIYLGEIVGKKVYDADSQYVGRLYDASVRLNEEVFPRLDKMVIIRGGIKKQFAYISFDKLQMMKTNNLRLNIDIEDIHYVTDEIRLDLSLCKDVLDQQVVDMDGRKVVRVNDAHLLRVDNQLYLAHVDVGLRGLVRRLGWTPFVDSMVALFSPKAPYLKHEDLISWKSTHLLKMGRSKNVLKSDMARKRLAKIPAAELADIMEDLDMFEKLSLFKTFSVDLQRKVFADMNPQEKEELVDQLTDQEAGNLLENIPADEATDLLNNLPKEKIAQLMRFMHSKTSRTLRHLLGFAEDTAGGLMTTEYLSLGKDALVKDGIQKIKDNVDYPGNLFFIYIVDERNRLVGITSFRRFISADPEKPLVDTCYSNNVFVRTDDGMEEIALLLEKYKFSAIPVLNEMDVLQGVITSDDVMEELISLTWKKYKDQL